MKNNLSNEKIIAIIYGTLYFLLGFLFKFKIINSPANYKELFNLDNISNYKIYFISFIVVTVTNFIYLYICNESKGLFTNIKRYYGLTDTMYYQEEVNKPILLKQLIILLLVISINIFLFSTFILLYIILISLIFFAALTSHTR